MSTPSVLSRGETISFIQRMSSKVSDFLMRFSSAVRISSATFDVERADYALSRRGIASSSMIYSYRSAQGRRKRCEDVQHKSSSAQPYSR